MFASLKPEPAPEGPVEFHVTTHVERPVSEVYPLIDWADPRNAKRQLGDKVEAIDAGSGWYRLTMAAMPEHRFDMRIIEALPEQRYAFCTEITPSVGRLVSSEEHYSVEPLADGGCRLKLRMIATFQTGLDMDEFEEELALMGFACQRAVAKLKIHAEDGVEAVKALDLDL